MRPTVKQLRIIMRSAFEAADDGIAACPETQACLDAKWIVRDVFKMRSGRHASKWSQTQTGVEACKREGLIDSCGRPTARGLALIANCEPEPTIEGPQTRLVHREPVDHPDRFKCRVAPPANEYVAEDGSRIPLK